MITRADIAGALKFAHANDIQDRVGRLKKMVAKEHTDKDTAKIMSDLSSYDGFDARKDLDAPEKA